MRPGTADLRLLGAANVPRQIIRHASDPYAMLDAEPIPSQIAAITCSNTFVDTGLNPRWEYRYEVIDLTLRTGTGCALTAGTPVSSAGLISAGVTLPLTEAPTISDSRSDTLTDPAAPLVDPANPEDPQPRVGQTVSDAARERMVYGKAHPEFWSQAAPQVNGNDVDSAAARNTGSQFVFDYQGYIEEDYIPAPGFGTVSQPFVMYNGSTRAWYEVNSGDSKFRLRAYVGDNSISYTEYIGQTRRYHCYYFDTRTASQCSLAGYATASVDEIAVWGEVLGSTTKLSYVVATANPMQPGSPQINGELTAMLSPTSWTLRGWHDRMPVHQFWWAPFYSEGVLAYTSDVGLLNCLFSNVPGCRVDVNQRL